MVEHLRFPGQNQERFGVACHVLCFQISSSFPVQGATPTEEEAHGM